MATKAVKARRSIVEVDKEYAQFKQLVIDTTMDWEGGCVGGKVEFLQSLDLPVPKKKGVFTVTISMDADPEDPEAVVWEALKAFDVDSIEWIEWRY